MSVDFTVSQHTHDDERFVQLSDPAQLLWIVLLTGPQRTSLPGLQRADVISLSATRRRPIQQVNDALHEIVLLGMAKHDAVKRVLLLPKFHQYLPPPNGNLIIGWYKRWLEVPDCGLKWEWLELMRFHYAPRVASGKGDDPRRKWAETFAQPKRRNGTSAPGVQSELSFSRADGQSRDEDPPEKTVVQPIEGSSKGLRRVFDRNSDSSGDGSRSGSTDFHSMNHSHGLHVSPEGSSKGLRRVSGDPENEEENENENGSLGRVWEGGASGASPAEGRLHHGRIETAERDPSWPDAAEQRRLDALAEDYIRR